MSGSGSDVLRTVTFGDLAAGLWGCIWGHGHAAVGLGASGADEFTGQATFTDAAGESWSVGGETVQLEVSPLGDRVEAGLGGFDQLCRLHGRIRAGGAERPVDCLGRRAVRTDIDLKKLDSIRDCSGWFEPDEGFALSALRPRRARGHGQDAVCAAWFEPSRAAAVAEPRLSSTYGRAGRLLRAGAELWLDEEPDSYPRRAAADALGEGARATLEHLELRAWPLLWRSRGREGAGVYSQLTPR